MNIPSVGFKGMSPSDLLPEDTKILSRPQKRIAELLKKHSNSSAGLDAPKSWMLRFLLAPSKFSASSQDASRLGQLSFTRTAYTAEGAEFDPKASVASTDDTVSFETPLAFRSIGYKSEPLPGFPELGIQFDERRGVIPNANGRIIAPGQDREEHLPGMYCAGWVKRGPTGVIASTMDDAFMTAENLIADWGRPGYRFLNGDGTAHDLGDGSGWSSVRRYADERGLRPVSWADWQRIDQVEKQRGQAKGKEREKIPSVPAMLEVLDG
jgi:adrenodoxin-NADP+ reductase